MHKIDTDIASGRSFYQGKGKPQNSVKRRETTRHLVSGSLFLVVRKIIGVFFSNILLWYC